MRSKRIFLLFACLSIVLVGLSLFLRFHHQGSSIQPLPPRPTSAEVRSIRNALEKYRKEKSDNPSDLHLLVSAGYVTSVDDRCYETIQREDLQPPHTYGISNVAACN